MGIGNRNHLRLYRKLKLCVKLKIHLREFSFFSIFSLIICRKLYAENIIIKFPKNCPRIVNCCKIYKLLAREEFS